MTIMNHAKKNAFIAICKACNDEIRTIDSDNLTSVRIVMDKHAANAKLLGFSKVAMMHQIGVMNGVLRCRD